LRFNDAEREDEERLEKKCMDEGDIKKPSGEKPPGLINPS
jgi:hypothetical protein